MTEHSSLIKNIEAYISKYSTLADPSFSLPLALWTVATHCFELFDAFPYLVITSPTKRSGKTRLAELLAFMAHKPEQFAAMTGPTIFKSIEENKPTIFCDEAEELSSEAAGTMRSVLNVGYRRGATIPRTVGQTIKRFPTYCPKVFILIGDPFDTLKDRSIIITMRRAEPKERFTWNVAEGEGEALRRYMTELLTGEMRDKLELNFAEHRGLPFLQDRDEEIWTPLFCVAKEFCPTRLTELQMTAVDLATEKTADNKKYTKLAKSEKQAQTDDYRERLLMDLLQVLMAYNSPMKVIPTKKAVEALKAIPVAPWRRFKGKGITANDLANMLRPFLGSPPLIRDGYGRSAPVSRGYRLVDVEKAVKEHLK